MIITQGLLGGFTIMSGYRAGVAAVILSLRRTLTGLPLLRRTITGQPI